MKVEMVLLILVVVIISLAMLTRVPQPKACTLEAKICPDGSAVGRIPPNCDFAPCPSVSCKCPDGYIQEGDVCNPKCYYSIPKCLMPSFLCNNTIASTSCVTDSDCVGAECCHPISCINRAYKESCTGIACSMICQGPLDCGAGVCGCVNHTCVVIPS